MTPSNVGERKPGRFTLLLAASLVLSAISCLSGDVLPWNGAPKVLLFEWMGEPMRTYCFLTAPLVWAGLTGFAYRNYEKKWRWFLIGAPFALMFQLSGLLIIGAYHLCLFLHPGRCVGF
jgi:hypothetical protein